MELFDRFPPDLRALLAGALHDVEPLEPVLDGYYRLREFLPHPIAVQHIAQHLAQAEVVGIAKMARSYRERFNLPYPHTEAGASIMRPGARIY